MNGAEVSEDLLDRFALNMREIAKTVVSQEKHKTMLRMSNIGASCERQLYLKINSPEAVEEPDADAKMKFAYGHMIEELMLFLAEAAGHRVEGRQDEQEIEGVKGHRDAVIDGTLVDVKSASPFSFKKFKEGKLTEDDPFGYIIQGQSYLHHAQEDPVVTDKGRMAFLVAEKVSGERCLDFHDYRKYDLKTAYNKRKEVMNGDVLPKRGFDPVPDGYVNKDKEFVPNGNEKLGVTCSYCPVKHACHEGIRTFLSSRGPVFMTKVVKEPRLYEVKHEPND